MWKKSRWFIPPLVIIIVVLVLILGGDGPPTQEVANAERAVAEAKQKEADSYVPGMFSKAEENLKKAKDLIQEKKYREAKKAAEEAIRLAQEAISQVEPNKLKMKVEAGQMNSDFRKGIIELKSILSKPHNRMGPREQKELALPYLCGDLLEGRSI